MRTIIRIIFIIAVLVIMIGSFIRKKQELKRAKKLDIPGVRVDTVIAKGGVISNFYTYVAKIESIKAVKIIPKISQYVSDVLIDEGDVVKKGDILIRLDDRELIREVKAKNEEISSLESKLKSLKLNLDYIKREYKRLSELYTKKAISFDKFDKIKSQYEVKKYEYESVKSQLALLKEVLEKTKIIYSYTQIKAPFDGIITNVFVDKGDLVSLQRPVCEISSNKKRLYFYISDVDERLITHNSKVSFVYKDKRIDLKINKIFPSFDVRTFKRVEILLPSDLKFELNQVVNVKLVFNEKTVSVMIPKTSIVDNNKVFLVSNNRLKLKNIKPGICDDKNCEVISGINIGDEVVNAPFLSLNLFYDNQRVENK